MKEIIVLWLHEEDPTTPPPICPDTGRTVREVVADFDITCKGQNLRFVYSEEILPEESDSRMTIDGIPLEELVPLPDPSKYCGMACEGCGTGENSESSVCSRVYDRIPESVLRLALSKAATGKRSS